MKITPRRVEVAERARIVLKKFGGNWVIEQALEAAFDIRRHSRSWDREVEGFRKHISFNGSLKGLSWKDSACCGQWWRLDFDKEEELWYATYGTVDGVGSA